MAEWPSSLPNYLLQDGFSKTYADNLVRQDMSVGPPKARRRSTSGVTPIKGRQVLTSTQLATFSTFFETTLSDGATTFTWVDPITRATASFKFASPPTVTTTGGPDFYIDLDLVIMP
jgi:hypothetical protein